MPPSPFSSRNESLSNAEADRVQRFRDAQRRATADASGRNGKPFSEMSLEELEAHIGRPLPKEQVKPELKSAPRRKKLEARSAKVIEFNPEQAAKKIERTVETRRDTAARYDVNEAREIDEELRAIRSIIASIHERPDDATLVDQVRDLERRYLQKP